MPDTQSAGALALIRLQRLLILLGSSVPDRSAVARLTDRVEMIRKELLSDAELSVADLQRLAREVHAISSDYDVIAARERAPLAALPESADAFRAAAEASEIHFRYLAGHDAEQYRGGLLRELRNSEVPSDLARLVALDVVTSASEPIAISKVHLTRAAVALAGSEARRRLLLDLVEREVLKAIEEPAWREAGLQPAIGRDTFLRHVRFRSTVAERRLSLPEQVRANNAMFPNRPLAGWEEANYEAVASVLDELSRAGVLFVDKLSSNTRPLRVAMKIELNMGVDGPPSVSDPVVTGAVLFELLERAHLRGVALHFTVGDSCGIENAPVGRTSMDIMRDTGNFHHSIKAALRFVLRRDADSQRREAASAWLNRMAALEFGGTPVFLGGVGDTTPDIAQAEELARPWVQCVDYDETGFVPVRTDLGALGLASWGTRDFHVARPWVDADYRVHVTRGCSTHLFAGWTGALKGLIGLHALGLRPADQALNELGQSALDMLSVMMQLSGFNGILSVKTRVGDLNAVDPGKMKRSTELWQRLKRGAGLAPGYLHWTEQTLALQSELGEQRKRGTSETAILAEMRRRTRTILEAADQRSPGFRQALWDAVYEGTRSGLLAAWRVRSMIPLNMRDERMGMRIGVLAQLPWQADLVVQGLPKIGIGGGPDAYETVQDVGVVVAGTDDVSVDLAVLRAAGIPGDPWEYNYPLYGALQFGRGPALWDEITLESGHATASA